MPDGAVARETVVAQLEPSRFVKVLHAALDNEGTGVAILRPVDGGRDYIHVYANLAYESLKPFDVTCGRRFSEVWPELHEQVAPRLQRVLDEGGMWVGNERRIEVDVGRGTRETRYYDLSVCRIQIARDPLLVAMTSEVTASVTARKELSEARRQLEEFVGRITEAVFSLDRDWRFTMVTKRAEELLGRREDELLGARLLDALPELKGTAFEDAYRRAIETQEPVTLRDYYAPAGRWFDVRAYPSSTGLSVFFSDATAAVLAEQERELGRERLRTLIATLPVAVGITDASGRILEMNRQVELLWGGVPRAQSMEEYARYRAWCPDTGRPLRPEDWPAHRALHGETVLGEEIYIERLDGGRALVLASSAPITDSSGAIIGGVTVMQDITARMESDEELRFNSELLDNVSDSVLAYPLDGPDARTIVYANKAAHEVRGYEQGELLGLDAGVVIAPEYRNRLTGWLNELSRRGVYEFESLHVRSDGARFPVEVKLRLVNYKGRRMVLNVSRDVTKAKSAESEINEAQRLLQRELEMTSLWLTAADRLSSLDLDEIVESLADAAAEGTGASRVIIQLNDAEGEGTSVAYSRGALAPPRGSRYGPEDMSDEYRAVIETGHVQLVNALEANLPPRLLALREELDYHYFAIVPLSIGSLRVGAMVIDEPGARHEFDSRQITFLEGLAPQGAIAVNNALAYRKEQERARLGVALSRIDRIIHSSLELEDVVAGALREGAEVIGAESAAIDGVEGEEWAVWYDWGFDEPIRGTRYTSDKNQHGLKAVTSGQTIVIEDVLSDPLADAETMNTFGVKSTVVAPLVIRGETIAALNYNYHSNKHEFTSAEVDFVSKIASSLSLAIENARLYSAERHIADRLQEALLAVPDVLPGLDFAHVYRSATETARVGGDFYDIFEIEHGMLGVVIGDVAGKGLDAAVLTSLVKNTIRAHATEKGNAPAVVLDAANEVVYRSTEPDVFVTVFFGVLEMSTGRLTYSNAGHTTGLVINQEGAVRLLPPTGPILGAFLSTPFQQEETTIGAHDTLFVYTDGLIEARSDSGFFGEERLVGLVEGTGELVPQRLVEQVLRSVLRFTGNVLSDDLALLALRPKEDASAPDQSSMLV